MKKNKKYNTLIIIILITLLWVASIYFMKDLIPKQSNIITVDHSKDISDILKIKELQKKDGRIIVLWLKCEDYDKVASDYCILEQVKLKEFYKQTTWESVLKQWNEYIKWFDCMQIVQEVWQKYCIEKQKTLLK